jgi:hypothetical protein
MIMMWIKEIKMTTTISRFLSSHEMPESMVRNLEHAIRKNLKNAGHKIGIYFFQALKKPNRPRPFYGWRMSILGRNCYEKTNIDKINECSPVEWELVGGSILKVKAGQQLILTVGHLEYIHTWNDVEWELTAVDAWDGEHSSCMEPAPDHEISSYEIACHCPWCDPTIHPSSVDEYTFRKS